MTTKTMLYSVIGVSAATLLSICDLCKAPAQAATTQGAVHGVMPVDATLVPKTVTFAVHGMTCGGCVVGTRTVLTRLKGVTKAEVSYEKGTAVVTYDPARVTVAQMIAAIATLHYTATLVTSANSKTG